MKSTRPAIDQWSVYSICEITIRQPQLRCQVPEGGVTSSPLSDVNLEIRKNELFSAALEEQ